ncbi:hypothetical protein CU098_008024 [Rhizopus stolonifer]|uniref:Uncharacterized protein n=1 Tax=Rhizopus stolonifer TaxID=4846 RepID=A0A367JW15_RHIST|nr:hypothetical protein CU098_008024 [Rhizopus stolonifer]
MTSEDNSTSLITNDEELYLVFHYHPSRDLAYVGIAVFAILALLLLQTVHRQKAPKFMMKVPILAILECVGFILRVEAINGKFEDVAIAMNVLLLIAPNLLSLANYNCMIHILTLADIQNEKILYRPKVASMILTACTLSSSILQAAGGGMISNTSTKDPGYALLFVGLVFQLIVYLAYIFILNYVHKNPKFDYQFYGAYNPKQQLVYFLYITTSAFVIRNVYRIIQYSLLLGGHPISSEWTFYVFDALMVAACFAIFVIIPRFFPRHDTEKENEMNQPQDYNTPTPPYEPHYPQSTLNGSGNNCIPSYGKANMEYKPDTRF